MSGGLDGKRKLSRDRFPSGTLVSFNGAVVLQPFKWTHNHHGPTVNCDHQAPTESPTNPQGGYRCGSPPGWDANEPRIPVRPDSRYLVLPSAIAVCS